MSRTGNNPLRSSKVNSYGKVVVSAILHLPEMDGYHKDRFEVIKVSLNTMRRNAGTDCQVLIWDNGSCSRMTNWLQKTYKPDYLMLSNNIGKASARASIVRMVPDDTIIGIADDDMYYYPGWLTESIKLLQGFPNAGQVSGYPVRTQFRWGCSNTLQWAHKRNALTKGKFITEEWDRDFCTSIGRDYDYQVGTTVLDYDYIIKYQGLEAFAVAHHCQFIAYAGRIAPFCKYDDYAMGDEKPFDNAVDAAGLLRLTTVQRYTRHIGNRLDDDLIALEKGGHA